MNRAQIRSLPTLAAEGLEGRTPSMEETDNKSEGIELDRIEVPPRTPSVETRRSRETKSEAKASPSTAASLTKLFSLVSKKKVLLGAALTSLLLGAGAICLSLKGPSWDTRVSGAHYIGTISYETATSVSDKHDIRFKLSIPFRTHREKNKLMQELPSIKQELFALGNRPDWEPSMEQQDLQSLREHIVQTVHALTDVPVEALDVKALSVK